MNNLLFMDNLKLRGRSEDGLESLINVVQVFSWDIGMEFRPDKPTVEVLKQGVKVHYEGIVFSDGQMMGEADNSGD